MFANTALGESHDAYNQVYNEDQGENKGSLSHEVIAGGASFAAFKAFEDHQRAEGNTSLCGSQNPVTDIHIGKPVSHAFAKELIAGFAGAEVDKLAETKGEDYFDKEKAKHHAKKQAEELYEHQYGQYDEYNPNEQGPPERIQVRDSF